MVSHQRYYRISFFAYFEYLNHSKADRSAWRCKIRKDGKKCGAIVPKNRRMLHLKTAHSELFEKEIEPTKKTWLSRVGGTTQ